MMYELGYWFSQFNRNHINRGLNKAKFFFCLFVFFPSTRKSREVGWFCSTRLSKDLTQILLFCWSSASQGVAFVCRVDAGSLPLYLQSNQLEREDPVGVMVVVMVLMEGKQLPFKGTIQKLYISLPLTVHWPELSHMGTRGQRKLGNIILTDWPCA